MKRISTTDDSSSDFTEVEIELASVRNPVNFTHEKITDNENEENDLNIDQSDRNEHNEDEDAPIEYYHDGKYAKFWAQVDNYFFDPRVPRVAQLFRKENICVVMCYVLVGLFEGITRVVMNVYPLELGATEAQQTTIKVLRSLPASFKILFGFLSDTVPLFGYRRKMYMGISWGICTASMLVLALTPVPSIPFLSLMYMIFGFAMWFADVMADSIVAEKAKFEPEEARGILQSTCYASRFFFLMFGALAATFGYELINVHLIFFFLGIAPILIVALPWYWFFEERYKPIADLKVQCDQIWQTVSNRSVFQPMGFVFIFNALQISNAAWTQYLYTTLNFSTAKINSIMVVAFVMIFVGVMAYKQFMRDWSWRNVYVLCITLNCVFSLFQVMLIKQWNKKFNIPNFAFALGDESAMDFISGVQFLPLTIMMVHLCPEGSEGVSYSMFTTMNNVAITVSIILSTALLPIWDVSESKLEKDKLNGFLKLTILTTCLQTCGILFLPLLPRYRKDLNALSIDRSVLGGVIFLGIIIFALLWAIISGVLNIVDPGWMGES